MLFYQVDEVGLEIGIGLLGIGNTIPSKNQMHSQTRIHSWVFRTRTYVNIEPTSNAQLGICPLANIHERSNIQMVIGFSDYIEYRYKVEYPVIWLDIRLRSNTDFENRIPSWVPVSWVSLFTRFSNPNIHYHTNVITPGMRIL